MSGHFINLSLVAALCASFELAAMVASSNDEPIIRYGMDVTDLYKRMKGLSGMFGITSMLWCVSDCILIDSSVLIHVAGLDHAIPKLFRPLVFRRAGWQKKRQ